MAEDEATLLRKIVGELIRQHRLDAQLNQSELADRLGVPQPWVSNVENAARRIDIVEAWHIADILQIDLSLLQNAAHKEMERRREE